MGKEERDLVIIKRLTVEPNKTVCDCEVPAPYRPKGICAPIYPINHCLVCGGFCKNECLTDKGAQS